VAAFARACARCSLTRTLTRVARPGAFLADDDARFAAGIAPGEEPRVPPAWLALPATIERATATAD
jgi:hypothetical protein